ncbi:hypothetical protein CSUI_003065 [Cystoisospora suis]|uniref:Uncharacterized protein n=1 Tax=Cystoisospora suis TaxID=483139 RepID=A0A2C6L6M6_9APIC|nr:hypothetical protein CSUI_003065 [Cystoisospora suis]
MQNGPVPQVLPAVEEKKLPVGTVNIYRSPQLIKPPARVEVKAGEEQDLESTKEPSDTEVFQHSVLEKQKEALRASGWFSRQVKSR